MSRKQIKTQLIEPTFWLFYNTRIVFMGDKSNFAVGVGEGVPAQHTVIFMSRVWGRRISQDSTK